MDKSTARNRAELSGKLTNVLNSRSLTNSHKRLADILTKDMTVLDVGCGTGAITRGIAEVVGPNGRVVGIDNNPTLIEKARQAHGETPGLTFETRDIYNLAYDGQFDIVTCARVLIWLSDPLKALKMMIRATKMGGRILIADYNHEKIAWEPQPPSSMLSFYSAYLKWRSDAGMDNAIADHLSDMFQRSGIEEVTITPQHEATKRADPDFQTRISIWADTASSRGIQMKRDGYITEKEYVIAEKEYREWVIQDAQSLTMYMLAVEGVRHL
ncbi:methyltransferase domain-containing protein [Aneurinibacillus migulanus]|uniref:Ubiquinone biosynthesis methyltransferase UbiE n=1 Tax=Aneurinibacillus migulanus TaxID=47500 RepID=A0A0D1Y846_ANEMI|nr:methyltransferase domain-containing protein [Aneurinibacillus migulanus]KIV55317.1 ubiquinone biosynthesis methyltransferase UbiE [Aneurinibacillus migulanus]KON96690.1 ubiquinone biosynthesis methyltransferase UbiE [Aneurinibacillus migulanus]MED0896495.1 methyltransferase domain-containing protein [Aneurinibacillus migulanus]MED1618247.1 methyltransferase domain-containing protein [Aneurinibacillus migulanus]SDJ86080.1 Ubiquinone/menaquinone biosynthesis C-methylase UbiE [Aneurinibacillus